ncbi:sulfurtransferase [Ciceribacter thiooxidans]|uniref:Sulfurtransferase n=1 Tax=Ciceribacter thiooxidans TaxID=1969821 RepID=A0ABV7I612_9HYPH|nr:sulfurtransferase [Ciceribacter thiooxidans]
MRFASLAALAALTLAIAVPASAERLTEKPLVDAAWLQSNLGKEGLVVIDVRDAAKDKPNPYMAAHIPGSVSAPYSTYGWRAKVNGIPGQLPPLADIEAKIAALGVSNESQIVIVPAGTDSSEFGAATRVYWTFKVLGHDAVTILDGGWRAWQAANGETSADVVQPQPASFKANFRDELYASTADVEKARASGDVQLVDGRPAEQFAGKAKSPVVRLAGTIPGAVNLEQGKLYDAQKGSFVSPEKVAALAGAAGVKEDEQSIAFCNTGHWASVAWFGLSEVEGKKNVKLYDGSMAEWASDPARPVTQ